MKLFQASRHCRDQGSFFKSCWLHGVKRTKRSVVPEPQGRSQNVHSLPALLVRTKAIKSQSALQAERFESRWYTLNY